MLGVTMRRYTPPEKRRQSLRFLSGATVFLIMAAAAAGAQTPPSPAPLDASASNAPVTISLDEAIRRAQTSEPGYAAASAASGSAALDRSIARAGLLPSVVYHNQALYTQPNHLQNLASPAAVTQVPFRFIASNAVREYSSQAVVNETVGLNSVATVRRADAASALASAELEIARRGLLAAVVGLYYTLAAADDKSAVAERARAEADDFVRLTTAREQAREAAHADVVKAQLQQQQRDRDLSDARLAAERARLELAVLLFADPHTPYSIAASQQIDPLPARDEVNQAAARNNPELKGAMAALNVSNADVLAARAAYLPDLGLNVTYGIDTPQFATTAPDHLRNLGYSASVTLDIPVWDWLATQHKVKQSEIRRNAVRVALTATQRQLIARLDEAYAEAAAARDQLASLDTSATMAAESLRLTRLRYSSGEATVLEVVDAQTTLMTAEDARADGRVRYKVALADLQTLTGTM